MAKRFCAAVAGGLLFAVQAHVQARAAVHGAPSRPVELSEAFPWDAPVEQTFTVESVLRWRRSLPVERNQQTLFGAGGTPDR
jgi:hypothetical protein